MVAIIPIKKLEQVNKARQRFFKNMSQISNSFSEEDPRVLDDLLAEATKAAKIVNATEFISIWIKTEKANDQ